MAENRFKTELRKWLRENDIYYANISQGDIGSKPGDPDIVICVDGRFVGLECKTYTGSKRNMQIVRKEQIERSGGICIFPRTIKEVEDLINKLRE